MNIVRALGGTALSSFFAHVIVGSHTFGDAWVPNLNSAPFDPVPKASTDQTDFPDYYQWVL